MAERAMKKIIALLDLVQKLFAENQMTDGVLEFDGLDLSLKRSSKKSFIPPNYPWK